MGKLLILAVNNAIFREKINSYTPRCVQYLVGCEEYAYMRNIGFFGFCAKNHIPCRDFREGGFLPNFALLRRIARQQYATHGEKDLH
jgi:hypothetical protein